VGGALEHVDPSVRGKRVTEAVLYAIAGLLAVVALYHARHFYEDDAYITLRFARRWIDGAGPTWTDGERVQGYTHPLWLLQLALLGRLGADLPLASRVLGVLYFGAIFAVFHRARALPFSVLALATLPGLSVWAMAGLETVSFAFWLVLAALLTMPIVEAKDASRRAGALAGAALAAAALTRPEGVGVALVVGGWVAVSRQWRALRALAATFVAPVVAWELFSGLYYGDLVANPVYAKITGYPLLQSVTDGFAYLAAAASSWAWAVLASLLALALAGRVKALWVLAMALPIVLGLLVGGGDHMVGTRLFVPAAVLVVFAAGVYGRTKPGWVAPVLLVSAATLQAPVALAEERKADGAAVIGGSVGRFLEKNLPGGSLVAISVAGSTAFFAPSLRFIDTLGLTDRHIARRDVPVGVTAWQAMAGHRKGDGDYVLSRSPDVVILGSAAGFLGLDEREWFLTDYELLESARFRREYMPYAFRLEDADVRGFRDIRLTAYLHKGSSAADAFAAMGARLRGPWYAMTSHSTAATATGVGFQPQ
jgi:arabinofuranosyltransferase